MASLQIFKESLMPVSQQQKLHIGEASVQAFGLMH